jgi:catechol 2,3-dioxygenase-like lactoylglutathione lyase family enzyme
VRVFRVALPASHLDESVAFYEQVLGVSADRTVPHRVYFHCGDVILAVIDWSAEGRNETFHPNAEHVYFATPDLDRTYARVAAAGATIESAIVTQPWGERSFYCLDPDGHRLCFVDDLTLFLGRGASWA